MEWNNIELKWHEMALRLQAKPGATLKNVDECDLPNADAKQMPTSKAAPTAMIENTVARVSV